MKFVLLIIVVVAAGDNSSSPEPRCTGAHEFYSKGYDPCPPQTCAAKLAGITCPAVLRPLLKGCRCEKDYVRDDHNKCITVTECLQNKNCLRAHEYKACGNPCDNECPTLGTQNRTHCPIVNTKCKEQCYCQDGYARDLFKNCVPVNTCTDRVSN